MRIRQILFGLLQAPRFSIGVIATLGLGLTVSVLMAALLWQAVLKPLPFRASHELVVIEASRDAQDAMLSAAEVGELPALLPAGYSMAGFTWDGTTFVGGERPESVTTLAVSSNFFEVLGSKALLGRTLQPGDGERHNVVLTESSWRKHFNADPNVVGKVFKEDDVDSVIIGVAPKSLEYMASGLAYFHEVDFRALRERAAPYVWARYFVAVLRAPTGASTQANAALAQAHTALAQKYGAPVRDWQLASSALELSIRGNLSSPLWTLAALSLLVLGIAAVNAAHMVMTRGKKRAQAFAVMDALGASRRLLAGIVLGETALLAFAAGTLAILLSWVVVKVAPNFAEAGLPIDDELGAGLVMGAPAILAACVLAMMALAMAGLYPALKVAREGANATLRGPQHSGAKRWLGIPGVALSLAALVAAGLFFRSAQALRDQPLGLNVDNTVIAQIFMRGEDKQDNRPLWAARAQALLDTAKRIPGAESVAISNGVPFSPVGTLKVSLDDGPALQSANGKASLQTVLRSVLGAPLKTLGYSLRAGRDLRASDSANAERVMLVNELFAKQYFGDLDVIGKSVNLPPMGSGEMQAFTVVGILGDARFENPATPAVAEVWLPFAQYPSGSLAVFVRGAPGALKAVQEAIWQENPAQAIFRAYDLSDSLAELSAAPRFFAQFAGLFAWLALILAALGIYAIFAFDIAERSREFALRAALGAKPARLLRTVLLESQRVLIPGIVLGALAGAGIGKLLEAQVYGEFDLASPLLLASLIVITVGIAASLIAARAAVRVNLRDAITAS
jgi:putative ABC transport system permease protein